MPRAGAVLTILSAIEDESIISALQDAVDEGHIDQIQADEVKDWWQKCPEILSPDIFPRPTLERRVVTEEEVALPGEEEAVVMEEKVATAAAHAEPVYTVLDPRSYEPGVEYQGLTPRLDTLEGKTVGIINMGGAGSEVMRTIGPALEATVPGCSTLYREMRPAGAMEWDFIESCDAIILGHNY